MFMRAITRSTRITPAEAPGSGGRPPNRESLPAHPRAAWLCRLASIGDDPLVIGVVTPQAPAAHGAPLEPARALEQLGQLARQLDSVNHEGVLDPDLDLGAERLQYVSPEQILGRPRGLPSDVYSLSAVLYRHLTGAVPFPDGHGRALFFWHLHAPRPRPTAVRPDLPAAIDAVIERGMATDPSARPPSPGALIEEARSAFGLGPAPEHSRRVGAPAPPEQVP